MKNKITDITNNLDLHSAEKKEGGGIILNGSNKLFELYQEGDKRCEFQIGDRIKKKIFEPGDAHQIGHEGIIVGNLYVDDIPVNYRESYLVQFKEDNAVCLTVKYKIELHE